MRGMSQDRKYLGAPAHVPGVRQGWLLRFLQKSPCHGALPRSRAPDSTFHRTRRGMALVLHRQGVSRLRLSFARCRKIRCWGGPGFCPDTSARSLNGLQALRYAFLFMDLQNSRKYVPQGLKAIATSPIDVRAKARTYPTASFSQPIKPKNGRPLPSEVR